MKYKNFLWISWDRDFVDRSGVMLTSSLVLTKLKIQHKAGWTVNVEISVILSILNYSLVLRYFYSLCENYSCRGRCHLRHLGSEWYRVWEIGPKQWTCRWLPSFPSPAHCFPSPAKSRAPTEETAWTGRNAATDARRNSQPESNAKPDSIHRK